MEPIEAKDAVLATQVILRLLARYGCDDKLIATALEKQNTVLEYIGECRYEPRHNANDVY